MTGRNLFQFFFFPLGILGYFFLCRKDISVGRAGRDGMTGGLKRAYENKKKKNRENLALIGGGKAHDSQIRSDVIVLAFQKEPARANWGPSREETRPRWDGARLWSSHARKFRGNRPARARACVCV